MSIQDRVNSIERELAQCKVNISERISPLEVKLVFQTKLTFKGCWFVSSLQCMYRLSVMEWRMWKLSRLCPFYNALVFLLCWLISTCPLNVFFKHHLQQGILDSITCFVTFLQATKHLDISIFVFISLTWNCPFMHIAYTWPSLFKDKGYVLLIFVAQCLVWHRHSISVETSWKATLTLLVMQQWSKASSTTSF